MRKTGKIEYMSIQLQILPEQDLPAFKRDMQEAFQKGAEAEYGSISAEILPESHINASLSKPGSVAYAAMEKGCMVGGAIVQIVHRISSLSAIFHRVPT